MTLEKMYSLSQAAKIIGIQPKTLKRWLAEDLGMVLPRVARGGKALIRERDIEIVVRKRTATSNWSLLRKRA